MKTNDGSGKKVSLRKGLFLLVIILILLTGCHFPGIRDSQTENQGKQLAEYTVPTVKIQFILQLAQPVEGDERILIEILDEVTGLPYNITAIELEKKSELEFSLEKPFPAGSVVKYRYARLSDSRLLEIQPNGDPVRYRLFYADQASQVVDQVWGWHGETPDLPSGLLAGTILDRVTNVPVPDILISAAGQLTFTDVNGQFSLVRLPSGIHNLVVYAIDGSYQTFQQGAQISPGSTTPARIGLHAMPPVKVHFIITPPEDALGAPVYIAGNLSQLGNTFSELAGSMSLYPKKMPSLTAHDDGTLTISLNLYAGTDLRYKFTLGDGYWNAERTSSGKAITHQLIIPNQDITINQRIESWRTSSLLDPVTFNVTLPADRTPQEEIFIQFRSNEWTEPIPLWPVGGGNLLYILFSPLAEGTLLGYRFCRNSDCEYGKSAEAIPGEFRVDPDNPSQRISIVVDGWKYWTQGNQEAPSVNPVPLPLDPSNYAAIIELTPEMNPAWEVYAPVGLSSLTESGVSTVIFTPSWHNSSLYGRLEPVLGRTPFFNLLSTLLQSAKSFGLRRGIFPQIDQDEMKDNPWYANLQTEADWESWRESYRRFLLSYAKTAEITQTEWLVVGGQAYLPEINDDLAFWQSLLADVQAVYQGEILWAVRLHTHVDPLPEFVNEADGIYLLVDSPLADTSFSSFDEIAMAFTNLVDNHIYEVFRSTTQPLYLALAYPSVEGAAQGCRLISSDCHNDGLFLPSEMESYTINQSDQNLVYSAILPVIASRDWIAGTSIRGYEPTVMVQDGSSSVAGKTAMRTIQDWFLRIQNSFTSQLLHE